MWILFRFKEKRVETFFGQTVHPGSLDDVITRKQSEAMECTYRGGAEYNVRFGEECLPNAYWRKRIGAYHIRAGLFTLLEFEIWETPKMRPI